MNEVYEFLKKVGTYYLATVEGDQPRVRPFATVNLFEDKLYILTDNRKAVAEQLVSHPKVELSAVDGTKWLRLSGTLVKDSRVAAKRSMLATNPDLKKLYDENDANTQPFYFENAVATIEGFGLEKKAFQF
jgi:uncharacterized pyridoxamine 5'-phosphate oxidase family protein